MLQGIAGQGKCLSFAAQKCLQTCFADRRRAVTGRHPGCVSIAAAAELCAPKSMAVAAVTQPHPKFFIEHMQTE